MNVNDTVAPEIVKDKLEMIFERQEELKNKYIVIEQQNGIGYGIIPSGYNFDIDSRYWQSLIKDFACRSIEEVTEATEALSHLENFDTQYIDTHIKEELIDALHFLVELFLVSRINTNQIMVMLAMPTKGKYLDNLDTIFSELRDDTLSVREAAYNYIECLGLAMNCLKNKPWKQTHFMTDVQKYNRYLCMAFREWVKLAHVAGLDSDSTFDMYFRKSNVNEFRVRSKY